MPLRISQKIKIENKNLCYSSLFYYNISQILHLYKHLGTHNITYCCSAKTSNLHLFNVNVHFSRCKYKLLIVGSRHINKLFPIEVFLGNWRHLQHTVKASFACGIKGKKKRKKKKEEFATHDTKTKLTPLVFNTGLVKTKPNGTFLYAFHYTVRYQQKLSKNVELIPKKIQHTIKCPVLLSTKGWG